jgi:hypothetical protein
MMFSADEDYGDEITSTTYEPDDFEVMNQNESDDYRHEQDEESALAEESAMLHCPDCEKPSQFGGLCVECQRAEEAGYLRGPQ